MSNFLKLPLFTEEGDVNVVVETPRGSRAKFAFDPELKAFVFRKSLLTGLTYPHDWGFAPSTKAEDGDPLDIIVIHDATTFPGLVVKCRVIGILEIEQKSRNKAERNDRLFAVPRRSHSELALSRKDAGARPSCASSSADLQRWRRDWRRTSGNPSQADCSWPCPRSSAPASR